MPQLTFFSAPAPMSLAQLKKLSPEEDENLYHFKNVLLEADENNRKTLIEVIKRENSIYTMGKLFRLSSNLDLFKTFCNQEQLQPIWRKKFAHLGYTESTDSKYNDFTKCMGVYLADKYNSHRKAGSQKTPAAVELRAEFPKYGIIDDFPVDLTATQTEQSISLNTASPAA